MTLISQRGLVTKRMFDVFLIPYWRLFETSLFHRIFHSFVSEVNVFLCVLSNICTSWHWQLLQRNFVSGKKNGKKNRKLISNGFVTRLFCLGYWENQLNLTAVVLNSKVFYLAFQTILLVNCQPHHFQLKGDFQK